MTDRRFANRVLIPLLVFAATLAAILGFLELRLSNTRSPSHLRGLVEDEAARRAMSAKTLHRIQIAHRTMEILPTGERTIDPLPGGLLEVTLGVDPVLRKLGPGRAEFHVEARTSSGRMVWELRRRFDLDETAPAEWISFETELPENLDERLKLTFRREAELITPIANPRARATDLLYWAQPRLRPRRIEGMPNVLVVSIDTLRADHLGFMGYPRETSPHLDRLAKEGVAFEQCISQAPWTTPSHFSILTGLWPHRHGARLPVQSLARGWRRERDTLADRFRAVGFKTAAFTGMGSISAGYGFYDGFDFYDETSSEEDGTDVAEVVSQARGWLEENAERSFFLFVHTYEPHDPYQDEFFVEKEGIPPDDHWARTVARYDGDVRKADRYLGLLFEDLRELGLWESTLVVVTSDHGEELDERIDQRGWVPSGHGHSLYDELLHVPLILTGGALDASGLRIATEVRSVDIAPTILDYAGLEAPLEMAGASLRPLIERRDDTPRVALAEATTYGTDRVAIRTAEHKLIRRVSEKLMEKPGAPEFPLTPKTELYDLRADPAERRNLSGKGLPEEARLQSLLDDLWNPAEGGPPGESLADDRELIEALEALGYVDGDS